MSWEQKIKKKPSLSDNRVLVGAFYIALYSMLSFFRFIICTIMMYHSYLNNLLTTTNIFMPGVCAIYGEQSAEMWGSSPIWFKLDRPCCSRSHLLGTNDHSRTRFVFTENRRFLTIYFVVL